LEGPAYRRKRLNAKEKGVPPTRAEKEKGGKGGAGKTNAPGKNAGKRKTIAVGELSKKRKLAAVFLGTERGTRKKKRIVDLGRASRTVPGKAGWALSRGRNLQEKGNS